MIQCLTAFFRVLLACISIVNVYEFFTRNKPNSKGSSSRR